MDSSICKVHGKQEEFYCSNHGKTICSNCAVFEHKQCNIVTCTLDLNADSKANSDSKEMFRNMSDLKSRIETYMQTIESDQKVLRLSIVQESKAMRSKLKELETLLMADLDHACENQTADSRRHLARCDELLTMLQRGCASDYADKANEFLNSDLSKTFLSSEPDGNIITVEFNQTLKQNINQATSLGNVIVKNSGASGDSELPSGSWNRTPASMEKHLEASQGCQATYPPQHAGYPIAPLVQPPPPSYEQVLEKSNGDFSVNQAGITSTPVYGGQYAQSVSSAYGSQYAQFVPQVYGGQYPQAVGTRGEPQSRGYTRQHFSAVTSEVVVHFKAKTIEEKSFCCCSGICFLKDGSIAIADRKHRKIKIYSVSLQLSAETFLGCSVEPFDITQLDNGEIAVTCPKDQTVYFFDTRCQQINTLNVFQPCRGITSANRMMYVFCESSHEFDDCVRIYSLDKQLMQTISKVPNGVTIMNQASYIAVCAPTESIYYVKGAIGKCTVRCIDHSGITRWKSKVKSWSDIPRGMAAIEGGVLVVCDMTVNYISQNGNRWDKLLETSNPIRAIAVNEDKTMLLVTYYAYDCTFADQVSIYRLVYH